MMSELRSLTVCGMTIVLVSVLTSGSAFAVRRAALTPGWICVPTAAGQSALSGGTGAAPSCGIGTTVTEAPTYISSGDAGHPELSFLTSVSFGSDVYVTSPASFSAPVAFKSSVTAPSVAGGTLNVTGSATFSRSGIAKISVGKTSVTVPKVTMDTASMVLATVQGHVSGIWLAGVTKSVTASTVTIFLSKAPAAPVSVAWFVID